MHALTIDVLGPSANLALNLSSFMSRYVWIVSQPRSSVQVSFAVLCGVLRMCLAAFLCSISSCCICFLQASGTYVPSVP